MAAQECKPKAQPNPSGPFVIAGSVLTQALIFYGGYYQWPSIIPVPKSNDFDTKMIYTMRCLLPPLLVLAFAIGKVAMMRFLGYARNPLSGQEALVQKDKNFLQNTLEQLAVFVLTTLALMSYVQGEEIRLIPVYSFTFFVGRILYRIGYPNHRGFGFGMTMLPSFFLCALTVYFMVTRGFAS